MNKRAVILLLAFLGVTELAVSQTTTSVQTGIDYYRAGQWREAVLSLRRTLTEVKPGPDSAEALYWISLSELAMNQYDAALQDLDNLIKIAPKSARIPDAMYQKGRALYYVGQWDASIVVLKAYSDLVTDDAKKAAAAYWVGESLLSLGRLSDARSLFTMITERYPSSPKYEAAAYRIALIDQKGIENELLKLLKWSHEESLKTVEEYQRRERSYEQAIVAYQKRIADMLKETRQADLEAENRKLRDRVSELENQLGGKVASAKPAAVLPVATEPVKTDAAKPMDEEHRKKLETLRQQALQIQQALSARLEKQKEVEEVVQ